MKKIIRQSGSLTALPNELLIIIDMSRYMFNGK